MRTEANCCVTKAYCRGNEDNVKGKWRNLMVEWKKKEWKSKINLMGISHRSFMSFHRRLQKSLQVKPFKNFPCESEDGDANIFQNTLRSKEFQDWTLGTTRNSTNHFKFLELIHSLATFWHEIVKRNIIQGTWKTGHQIGNPIFFGIFWHTFVTISKFWGQNVLHLKIWTETY